MLLPYVVERMSDEEIIVSFDPPKAAEILLFRYRSYLSSLVKDVMKTLHGGWFMDFNDLYQSAVVGLIVAVNTFNPSHNTKFVTYLTSVARREILKEARRQMPIAPPRNIFDAGDEEGKSALERYLEVCNTISLNYPIEAGEDDEAIYVDVVDERSCFEDEIISRSTVAKLLSSLSQRERQVIELRFFENKTISEISRIIGRTPVTVRNIINRALTKMKKLLNEGGEETDGRTTSI